MAGKIFVNYRRGDERAMAARVRDRLATAFGNANVFMDVDNLMAGQRFDKELEKALAETDVFLAVIGPRWMELFAQRQSLAERDYVREEIAGALKRGIVVIPVLIERAPLPRAEALPEDIRELVLHQKHSVTHEQFGRDVIGLVDAIRFNRKATGSAMHMPKVRAASIGRTAAVALTSVAATWVAAYYAGIPVPWLWAAAETGSATSAGTVAADTARAAQEKKRVANLAVQEASQKAEAEAEKLRAVAEAKRKAEEAERQRVAIVKAAEEARRTPRPGQSFRDCPDVCPEMVVVPAGEFTMGSNDYASEKPPHTVTIKQSFAVGKFEVTFAEWDACVTGAGCKSKPSDQGWGRGKRPVIAVSWNDVTREYLPWLSNKTGKTYRLLSETEWEYAARAGTTTQYAFGDTITAEQAQFSASKTVEVGSFKSNAFGLYDMHGNAWEWVADNWHPDYKGNPPTDGSVWQGGDTSLRVLRGGSWINNPGNLRSANHIRNRPDDRSSDIGFRLARTL